MSYSIDGTDITLTRGDSLFLRIDLKKNGKEYIPAEGSSLRFAMKRKYGDAYDVLLEKQIPINSRILHIEPEDTKPFPMNRTYVYDIQITDQYGNVDTFIKGNLNLENEVT